MTRSKFVKLVYKKLYMTVKPRTLEGEISLIIQTAEDCGMLPPRRDQLDSYGNPTYAYNWEPESQTSKETKNEEK